MIRPLEMDSISMSKFKATCLAVIEEVRSSGRGIVITKRGEPVAEVVPPSARSLGRRQLGDLQGSARIVGDIVSPAGDESEWEALVR